MSTTSSNTDASPTQPPPTPEDKIMGNLYQRFPVVVERGQGARIWDIHNQEYIDCMGGYGVALVGYNNNRVNEAISQQISKIITVHSSLYNKTREGFLELLTKTTPKGLDHVHLNNSGAESVEAAIKFAKKFTGRKQMVAMKGAYHGKSLGALSLTFSPKYRKPFAPLIEGVSFSSFGNVDALRDAVTSETALVIIEPIQGESGIHVAPPGFLEEARRICDEYGALLVFDEIQAGLGRTGKMWASEHWNNTIPDILCLAKGLAGGVPIGATITTHDILSAISKGEHSSTFGGNPLSCAAGTATLQSLIEDNLVENAAKVGGILLDGLEELYKKHPMSIRAIRGKGLMIGVELKFEVRSILHDLIKRGILMLYSGRNILRLLPPLVLSDIQAANVLHALDLALTKEEEKRDAKVQR